MIDAYMKILGCVFISTVVIGFIFFVGNIIYITIRDEIRRSK